MPATRYRQKPTKSKGVCIRLGPWSFRHQSHRVAANSVRRDRPRNAQHRPSRHDRIQSVLARSSSLGQPLSATLQPGSNEDGLSDECWRAHLIWSLVRFVGASFGNAHATQGSGTRAADPENAAFSKLLLNW